MFILGILIIIALFVFRATYKVRPDDLRIQDKLRTRGYATLGAAVVAAILIIASVIRIVPPGSVGVQVLFGRVLTKATLSEGLNVVNPFVNLEIPGLHHVHCGRRRTEVWR